MINSKVDDFRFIFALLSDINFSHRSWFLPSIVVKTLQMSYHLFNFVLWKSQNQVNIKKKVFWFPNFSEWRTFSNDKDSKDRSRVGDVENRLLSSSGSDLSTMIGPMGTGFNNKKNMHDMVHKYRLQDKDWSVIFHGNFSSAPFTCRHISANEAFVHSWL